MSDREIGGIEAVLLHHFEDCHPQFAGIEDAGVLPYKCCLRRVAIAIDDANARLSAPSITMEHGTVQIQAPEEKPAAGRESELWLVSDDTLRWIREYGGLDQGQGGPHEARLIEDTVLRMKLAAERWAKVSRRFEELGDEEAMEQ